MPKSIGTDPLAVTSDDLKWLVGDITRQQEAEAAAQKAARGPTGVGGVLARSVPLGVGDLLHAITQAAGANPQMAGMDAAIDVGLGSVGAQRPGIPATASNLANRMAPPPDPGSGMQTLEAMARGGLAGAIGGPAGAAGGVGAGLGQDVAARLGAGPAGQMVGGLAGGLVGTGGAVLAARRGPTAVAGRTLEGVARRDDMTLPQALRQPGEPGQLGMERMGRTGEAAAIDMAGQGGKPADILTGVSADRLARYQSAVKDIREGYVRDKAAIRAQERATLDASKSMTKMATREEVQRARATVETAKDAARARVEDARIRARAAERSAAEAAAGDRVADAFERHAGAPEKTLRQYEGVAEQQLRQTGRDVFGPLEQIGEIVPSEASQAIFHVLGENPQVRAAYRVFAPAVEHNPTFVELQKAYQLLGAQARQAARNGGALSDGTLMTDLYAARDALGQAMEVEGAVPGFKQANAIYRAKAVIAEAYPDGYASARSGKAPDIAARLESLASIDPDASEAFRLGMKRGYIDYLRELPADRSAGPNVLAPGSDAAARLRLAFPDDASFNAFVGEMRSLGEGKAAPSTALAEAKGTARNQLQATARATRQALEARVQSLREQGIQERAAIRAIGAREVERVRRSAIAQRDALPDPRLDQSVVSAGRVARGNANVDLNKAIAEGAAGLRGPAVRDAVLAFIRGRGKDVPTPARMEIVKLLIAEDPEFSAQAEKIIGGLASQRVQKYLGVAGAGAATAALRE